MLIWSCPLSHTHRNTVRWHQNHKRNLHVTKMHEGHGLWLTDVCNWTQRNFFWNACVHHSGSRDVTDTPFIVGKHNSQNQQSCETYTQNIYYIKRHIKALCSLFNFLWRAFWLLLFKRCVYMWNQDPHLWCTWGCMWGLDRCCQQLQAGPIGKLSTWTKVVKDVVVSQHKVGNVQNK